MKIYSVKIENNTDNLINGVDVFGGYKHILKKFNEDGSFEFNGIRIYCDDMTYNNLLFQTISNPLKIESFEFISDNENQLSSLITIQRIDSHGNILTRNNIPRLTEEKTKSVIKENFLLDGYTKISILRLYPKTTLTIQLIEKKKSKLFIIQLIKEIKKQLFG